MAKVRKTSDSTLNAIGDDMAQLVMDKRRLQKENAELLEQRNEWELRALSAEVALEEILKAKVKQ